ncbi:hypothetical protein AAF712_004770 [Marasmius tenuissimus]|uniref:Hemerythrin-like domain-containing protein n=1 Tax=Marasmius tenuissimus TaxID=585030 RepID=A0ABR3A3J3_9AGAR|nr:hypothetical protein PM082_007717 [Marasmius tenuissimus]
MSSALVLDLAKEITLDHENVRDLFQRFQAAKNKEEKAPIANTLIREIAVHGDAEEMSVYNDLVQYGLENVADHNREEHLEVKRMVYEAENASIDSPDYDEIMSRAVTTFLKHSEEEEKDHLPKLVAALSPEENDALARKFLGTRMKVPSRVHPSAPVSGGIGQKAAQLQAMFHDKIVETINQRQFVEVKYAHPEL